MITGDDRRDDAEWAWFADAYRQVPEPRPEAVPRAVQTMQTSVTTWHIARITLRWVLGPAAVAGLAVGGYSLVKSGRTAPTVIPSHTPRPPAALAVDSTSAAAHKANADTSAAAHAQPKLKPKPEPAQAPEFPATPDTQPAARPEPEPAEPQPAQVEPEVHEPVQPEPPPPAGVAPEDLAQIRAALGDSAMHRLEMLAHDAEHQGLPAASLFERALEGAAHGAPAAAILTAVEHHLYALHEARDILSQDATDDDLNAGAAALEIGVTAADLEAVWRQCRESQGRTAVALQALAGLAAVGVPPNEASATLVRRLEAKASDSTLLTLRDQIAADVARGVPPLDALRARSAPVP